MQRAIFQKVKAKNFHEMFTRALNRCEILKVELNKLYDSAYAQELAKVDELSLKEAEAKKHLEAAGQLFCTIWYFLICSCIYSKFQISRVVLEYLRGNLFERSKARIRQKAY